MRKLRLPTLSALALGTALFFTGMSAHAQSASTITAPISSLDQALDSIQRENSGSFAVRTAKLAPVIDQTYDLEAVLRSSVGASRYMQLSDAEKQKLLATFREYTIARYLSSFKPGSNAKFELSSEVRNSPVGSDRIVSTKIGPADDFSTARDINYVMRQENGSWKIVDVLLDGHISQAAAQRSDFGSTLASGGVNGLITVLSQKVKTFSEE